MAVLESRQVVAWSVPTLALLVSLLWLRRRYRSRDPPTSDPGGLPKSFSSTSYHCRASLEDCTLSPIASCSTENLSSGEEDEPVPEDQDLLTISEKEVSELVTAPEETETIVESNTLASEEEIEVQSTVGEELAFVSESESVCVRQGDSDSGITVTSEVADIEAKISLIDTEEVPGATPDVCEIVRQEEHPQEKSETSLEESETAVQVAEDNQSEAETLPMLGVENKENPQEKLQNQDCNLVCEEKIIPVVLCELSSALSTLEIDGSPSTELESNKEFSSAVLEVEAQGEATEMEKGVLEEKLASLVLDTMKINEDEGKQNAERDSANQSPSEVMLASPSISNFSDAHSEGSSDSGKGHSDVATSPSRTPAGGSSLAGDSAFSVYEFVLPQVMVGRLIGRHGSFIHEIRTSTHTNIFIKRHPDTSKLKICAIEGTQQDIDKALAKIRQKFPIRRFPKLTLEKVSFISVNNPPPLKPEDFHLQLVEGVNNDVILSSLISAAHFFLQQPSHPTYSALRRLNQVMNTVYSNAEAPVLETPVKDAICAAPTMGGWYRAQIVKVDEENQKCDVRFVDYGGYLTLECSLLRQIRGDLLMLPFQAVECYLANVVPVGDEEWSEEARLVVQSLTHGQVLQAQIYDYAEDGIPLVYLYSTLGAQIILINEELVARGFATIVTPAEE